MSRLIQAEGVGKVRDRIVRSIVLAMRELAAHQKADDHARDLVAYIAMALEQIDATIDETCSAWEKRDYWIKADQFRMQWAWTKPVSEKMRTIALHERCSDLVRVIPELAKNLGDVTLPQRNTLGEPWIGAYVKMREKHGTPVAVAQPEPMMQWRPKKK